MYIQETSAKLDKILEKLFRRDKIRYEAALRKMQEITNCEDTNHYKNLSNELKDFKRVHIDSHFVLIFKVDENAKTIRFEKLQHHDKIYR